MIYSEPYNIPDNGSQVITSLMIDEPDTLVENLKVMVNIEHTYIGDLIAILESPSGTRLPLHVRIGHGIDNLVVTYPVDAAPAKSLSLLDGEPLSGQWKLIVQDEANEDIGKLLEWGLIYKKKAVCEH